MWFNYKTQICVINVYNTGIRLDDSIDRITLSSLFSFCLELEGCKKKVNSNLVCEGNEKYFTFEIQDGTNPLRFQIYSPKSLKG